MNPRKGTVTHLARLDFYIRAIGSGGNESSEGDCDEVQFLLLDRVDGWSGGNESSEGDCDLLCCTRRMRI